MIPENPIFIHDTTDREEHLAKRAEQFRRLGCSEEWIASTIRDFSSRLVQVKSAFEANHIMKGLTR